MIYTWIDLVTPFYTAFNATIPALLMWMATALSIALPIVAVWSWTTHLTFDRIRPHI